MEEESEQPTAVSPLDDSAGDELASLNRRDFVKAAALMTGSLLLLLSRCRPPVDDETVTLPPIPADFKRFVLAEKSLTVAGELRIVALGSQCPDLACALWWAEDERFEFYERVERIIARYAAGSRIELLWLD